LQALERQQLADEVELDVGRTQPVEKAVALREAQRSATAFRPQKWIAGGHCVQVGVEKQRRQVRGTRKSGQQIELRDPVARLFSQACLQTGSGAEWHQHVDQRSVRLAGAGVDGDERASDGQEIERHVA